VRVGRHLARHLHRGRSDVGIEHDHVGVNVLLEHAAQFDVVGRTPDDPEPFGLE
jgi:hypothetical protein